MHVASTTLAKRVEIAELGELLMPNIFDKNNIVKCLSDNLLFNRTEISNVSFLKLNAESSSAMLTKVKVLCKMF